MSAPIPGDKYIRTLAHYLDSNEARFVAPPPLPSQYQQQQPKSVNGSDIPSLSTAVSSLLGGLSTTLSNNNGNVVGGSGQSIKSSSRPASIIGMQIPYMSLLAAAAPSSSALSMMPYMPPRSTLHLDVHHLYFLLVQFEHLGLDIGDPALLGEIPPAAVDETETSVDDETKAPSIMSVGSIASTMSTLSLSSGWSLWQKKAPQNRPLYEDVEHIYKFLARVSALKIEMNLHIDPHSATTQSSQRAIIGYEKPLAQDGSVILSLTPFRNLTFLELAGVHPRCIDGWHALHTRLKSLVITKAGVEDAADVIETQVKDGWERHGVAQEERSPEWSQLKMLSLADNNLTTLDAEPLQLIRSVTHLNLSSNLLIDVPAALSILYNLQSLNLSYNMISFTTGINTVLGNIQELDLRGNRLTVLAGLDRLWALERIDLRDNRIEDAGEVGRLTVLPNIEDIWVQGNPFTVLQPEYRVNLFIAFKSSDLDIQLDGTRPTFAERRKVSAATAKDDYQAPAASIATDSASSKKASGSTAWPIPQAGPNNSSSSDNNDGNEERNANKPCEGEQHKIARAKTKKAKRYVRLGKADEPLREKTDEDQSKHMHRLAELEQAVQHEALSRRNSASSKHKRSRSKSRRNTSPTGTDENKGSRRSLSPTSETFRRRIESMRREAGTEWLRVLQEMELGQKQDS